MNRRGPACVCRASSDQLQLGLTYLVAAGLHVEPTVAFGLGASTPDFTLGINVPHNF